MSTQNETVRASWKEQLQVLHDDIAAMTLGPDRDAAAKRANQLEAAIYVDGWLASRELTPPT